MEWGTEIRLRGRAKRNLEKGKVRKGEERDGERREKLKGKEGRVNDMKGRRNDEGM